MASFKVMRSANSRNSDLSRRITSSSSSIRPHQFRRDLLSDGYGGYSSTPMTVEGILHDTFASDPPATESSLLDTSITLMDTSPPAPIDTDVVDRGGGETETTRGGKSVDELWREMVTGEGKGMKEETEEEIMTLEDFLAKAAVEDAATTTTAEEELEMKIPPPTTTTTTTNYGFDHSAPPHNPFQMIDKVEGSIVAFGNGLDVYGGGARGKRARVMVEPLDKAAAQRQRRMIKNRESAARSRERKQAYQVELETLAAKLEEENELLCKEIEEKRKERYKKLMEFVIPVVEKKPQQQPMLLRRIRSLEW
ncbi:G-box-binding factor 4 [Cardamine amara subsp. amara]|uniref:G-box-binding factor 4 n=1 Tax=Cardamine amara subsp. amara TaxID=228776 RepID=A0ABD0ZYC8_CARAN